MVVAGGEGTGLLYLEWLRAVAELQPSLIIGENVKGLLSMQTPSGELVVDVIMREFDELG